MRLLNTSTLVVEEFIQRKVPEYAILSHTWEAEEVTLDDMRSGRAIELQGYAKVKSFCQMALMDGFDYCWIDTCCIDKTSSSELSEAINSMYRWYEGSCICYVYLPDVTESSDALPTGENAECKGLAQARWFTRGWTLQELIEPAVVEFYNKDWKKIGTKNSLIPQLKDITGIDSDVLRGLSRSTPNAAVRMSWASRRKTTRVEDEAYCLLGIFRVNMPLLYGEGRQAFRRLQEEILRSEEDYTLFATPSSEAGYRSGGLLAGKTSDFANFQTAEFQSESAAFYTSFQAHQLSRDPFSIFGNPEIHPPPEMTSRGVRISLPLMHEHGRYWACITLVSLEHRNSHILCRSLSSIGEDKYIELSGIPLRAIPTQDSKNFRRKLIYIKQFPMRTVTPRFNSNSNHWVPYIVILQVESSHYRYISGPNSVLTSIRTLSELQNDPHKTLDNVVKKRTSIDMELASKMIRMSPDELDRLLVHNSPSICYLPSTLRHEEWFAFGSKDCTTAFVVIFAAQTVTSCQMWSITSSMFEALESDSSQTLSVSKLPNSGGNNSPEEDYVTLQLGPDKRGSRTLVTASIKRIATYNGSSVKVPRFSLSIKTHTTAEHVAEPSLA
jgi:hypothetical protein